jgi:hypothetical protein
MFIGCRELTLDLLSYMISKNIYMKNIVLFQFVSIIIACTLVYLDQSGLAVLVCLSVVVARVFADYVCGSYIHCGIECGIGSVVLSWLSIVIAAKPLESIICAQLGAQLGWGPYSLSVAITGICAYLVSRLVPGLLRAINMRRYAPIGWSMIMVSLSGVVFWSVDEYAACLVCACTVSLLFAVFTRVDSPSSWRTTSIVLLFSSVVTSPILLIHELSMYGWWYLVWVPIGVSLQCVLVLVGDELVQADHRISVAIVR